MAKQSKLTRETRYSLVVIAFIVLALVFGYLGAMLRGGGAAAAATGNSGSWLNAVKSRGKLRVGVAIAPPMTQKKNGQLGGPNLIPLRNLAKELGVKLVTVPASWNNIVAGLQAGRYDAAANLDTTVQRAVAIQFSDPVYDYQGVFVVKGDSPYRSANQIIDSGKQVAVAAGSAPADAVNAEGAKTLDLGDYTNCLQAVEAGRAIAVFADLPTAESQVNANPDFKIVVPNPAIYEAGAGYGLPEGIDARSRELVNIAIADAQMSGELTRAYVANKYVPVDQLGDLEKK